MPDDDHLDRDDIDSLNRAAVERAAAIARLAGATLVAVGVLGAAAWAWVMVRSQDTSPFVDLSFGDNTAGRVVPWTERVDLFAGTVGLLLSACLVAGLGLLLRLAADYTQSRVGGSVTGFRVGDRLDEASQQDEP